MAVSLRLTNDSKRWQLQWNSNGKKSLYVTVSSLDGNIIAAQRVAMRLKSRVEGTSRRQNVEPFWVIRDEFVAEERASLHRQAALANSAVNTDGGSTAEEQIRESLLDPAFTSCTSGDVAVVASNVAAGGVATAAGQLAVGDAPEVDEEVGRPSDLVFLDPHLQPRTLQA